MDQHRGRTPGTALAALGVVNAPGVGEGDVRHCGPLTLTLSPPSGERESRPVRAESSLEASGRQPLSFLISAISAGIAFSQVSTRP